MEIDAIVRLEGRGVRWLPPIEWDFGGTLRDLDATAVDILRKEAAKLGGTPPVWPFCRIAKCF
ncbi:hypothetical protein FHX16_006326 [Rhizobium sp. BK661]|nr:hypothetical protein [Rhizobium sp. BK661]